MVIFIDVRIGYILRKESIMKRTFTAIVTLVLIISALCVPASAAETTFELPLAGTTGYGIIDLGLRSGDSSKTEKLGTVPAGTVFTILEEGSSYFRMKLQDGNIGWVSKTYTMVNLPDLIPSIRYNATNSYSALYRSCGKEIPEVTGKAFYEGKTWNAKLGYEEFNVPVLYAMAKKIASAQSAAMADGRTLVIYEGYRPLTVQQAVNKGLGALMTADAAVNKAVAHSGWGKNWFIAKSVSNHQRGFAIDTSLAEVTSLEDVEIDGRTVKIPSSYTEFKMPTEMHERSPAVASLAYGVDSKSATAWKKVPMAGTMNDAAKLLRTYCTNAGMSPLASEWWHFNDLDARTATKAVGTGGFSIINNVSAALG